VGIRGTSTSVPPVLKITVLWPRVVAGPPQGPISESLAHMPTTRLAGTARLPVVAGLCCAWTLAQARASRAATGRESVLFMVYSIWLGVTEHSRLSVIRSRRRTGLKFHEFPLKNSEII
jgi:hypothetical protein